MNAKKGMKEGERYFVDGVWCTCRKGRLVPNPNDWKEYWKQKDAKENQK